MASIQKLKKQIEDANALGIKNLDEKGVGLFASGVITTHDIMNAISMINVGGGSVTYTDIVYNNDGTFTLTDTDGVEHTMECEYADGKLTTVKYDGDLVELTYEDNILVKVGKTELLTNNIAKIIVDYVGLSYIEYPYIVISIGTFPTTQVCCVYCFKDLPYGDTNNSVYIKSNHYYLFSFRFDVNTDVTNINSVVDAILHNNINETYNQQNVTACPFYSLDHCYSNFTWDGRDENTTLIGNMNFDENFALGLISGGTVEVVDTTEIDALEDLIDNSGVLEDTGGTATEKVEQLIDKAEELDIFHCLSQVRFGGDGFPSNAKINLPKIKSLNNAFAGWKAPDYPIVEELNITAPLVTDVSMMVYLNAVVKKVVLNLSEQCTNMKSMSHASNVEEVVLNFPTKNVTTYQNCFFNNFRLKSIVGVLDFTSATSVGDTFGNCTSLVDVEFEPNTLSLSLGMERSAGLSANSIQSIIDGLATVETAQTLTLHKNIVLTDEQKATINAKGWTLAQ